MGPPSAMSTHPHPHRVVRALKRLVGLSYSVKLDMVNVALAGPNPLRARGERLNGMGIWWQYASWERLSAFIMML